MTEKVIENKKQYFPKANRKYYIKYENFLKNSKGWKA